MMVVLATTKIPGMVPILGSEPRLCSYVGYTQKPKGRAYKGTARLCKCKWRRLQLRVLRISLCATTATQALIGPPRARSLGSQDLFDLPRACSLGPNALSCRLPRLGGARGVVPTACARQFVHGPRPHVRIIIIVIVIMVSVAIWGQAPLPQPW